MSDLIAAGLAETIHALRSELTSAMDSGADERLHFELVVVQLEMTLAITREGSGDAGTRFGVVSFRAKGGLKDETTHHLNLSRVYCQECRWSNSSHRSLRNPLANPAERCLVAMCLLRRSVVEIYYQASGKVGSGYFCTSRLVLTVRYVIAGAISNAGAPEIPLQHRQKSFCKLSQIRTRCAASAHLMTVVEAQHS
jgi:hypothetical protein